MAETDTRAVVNLSHTTRSRPTSASAVLNESSDCDSDMVDVNPGIVQGSGSALGNLKWLCLSIHEEK